MKIISCFFLPWATGGVPAKHLLSRGQGLVLGADGTPFDIVGDVGIYPCPVDSFSGQGLHFLNPLMGVMYISKCSVEELWRDAEAISLQEYISLYGQLILGVPVVLGDPRD